MAKTVDIFLTRLSAARIQNVGCFREANPLNMRDGAIICIGLGNPDWNFSAPHGAGRTCSRTDAKYAYSVEEFQEQMKGVYTTTANTGTIDECPMAYKAPEGIISVIGDTVNIEKTIRPIYNFKACN